MTAGHIQLHARCTSQQFSYMSSNTLNPLKTTSLNPPFYVTKKMAGLTLDCVRSLFQMREYAKYHNFARKALLLSRSKMALPTERKRDK